MQEEAKQFLNSLVFGEVSAIPLQRRSCIRLLQRYNDALFDQLKLATIGTRIKLAETQGCDAAILMVDIFESSGTTSSIHQIYWELLEDERSTIRNFKAT